MSLPTTAIPANTCTAAITAAAPGAIPSDTVAWSFVGDVTGLTGYGGAGSIVLRAYSSANVVNVKLCNITAASVTPGAASINWAIPGRGTAPTVPTITHHQVGACTNGQTTCTLAGQVVGATGDAVYVLAQFCWNSACSGAVTPACGLTAADGTNTYTLVAGASITNSTTSNTATAVFVASNATSGTYTLTLTATGTGCTLNFGALWFADVAGVSTSPLDPALSATSTGTGTSMSRTSPANVTYANELMMSSGACWSNAAITAAGLFTMLDRTPSTYYANFYQAGPPQGAVTTFTANCAASSNWTASILGLHN